MKIFSARLLLTTAFSYIIKHPLKRSSPVAQSVEQMAVNHLVRGSSPRWGAKQKQGVSRKKVDPLFLCLVNLSPLCPHFSFLPQKEAPGFLPGILLKGAGDFFSGRDSSGLFAYCRTSSSAWIAPPLVASHLAALSHGVASG